MPPLCLDGVQAARQSPFVAISGHPTSYGAPVALARIITQFPEDSGQLADALRARGFEVETRSSPGTASEPADLEITMDECSAEEAMRRAALEAGSRGCVFIMPSTITEPSRPLAAMPLIARASNHVSPSIEPSAAVLPSADSASKVTNQTRAVETPEKAATTPPQASEPEIVAQRLPEVATATIDSHAQPEEALRTASDRATRGDRIAQPGQPIWLGHMFAKGHLFWGWTALAVGLAAVAALLLGLSPQPLPPARNAVRGPAGSGQVPFAHTQPATGKTPASEGTTAGPSRAASAPRRHSISNDDSSYVARDTVIRYGNHPVAPAKRPPAGLEPH